jgi:mono/diheme cytochrome c family protein
MNNQSLKTILFSLAIAGLVFMIHSCGSKTSAPATESTPAVAAVIDTKAPSDSKGVGRFKEVKLDALDPEKANLGKAIFTTKCTTCHKLNDIKFVGPGLLGVTTRRTPEWILNMITNPAEMIKSDPVAKKLFEETLTPMAFQNVSDDEARNILEYLRQNDAK